MYVKHGNVASVPFDRGDVESPFWYNMGRFSQKGTWRIHYKISSMHNRNVTLALKCMANKKFTLQLHNRYSDSQSVSSNA